MKIVFIGALLWGFRCLESLLEDGKEVVAVFTLSDKFKDRSGFVDFSPLCSKHNIPVFEIDDPKTHNFQKIKEFNPDLVLVIGWSWIVPDIVLDSSKVACIGNHPTLLPKHRGNAPLPWSIIMGLTKSGVTFFELEKDVDSGKIYGQKEFEIGFEDYASDVYRKALNTSVLLLHEVIEKLEKNTLVPIAQDSRKASKWPKRKPDDGIIDWNKGNVSIYNWIRGLSHPYPGAFTFLGDKKLFIWKASIYSGKKFVGVPGLLRIFKNSVVVKTGDGALLFEILQFEGDSEMSGLNFVKKYSVAPGIVMG
ncbi:methionyl-tRNA formyltransferase [Candidatus Micrarchaeota archaeon]|nr:methionyl-tRNA formyltransferase [Candidatus Micrarchaeota archaeon]